MFMEQRQRCTERHWNQKRFGTNDPQRCCHGLGFGGMGKRGFAFLVWYKWLSEVLSLIRFWRDGKKGFCLSSLFLFCLWNQFYIELLASHPRDVQQRKFLAVSFNSWCIFSSLMLCKLWLLLVLSVTNSILCVSLRICSLKFPIYCFFPLLSFTWFSICLGIVVTNSSAWCFGSSRHEDFKFSKGNVLLSCLGEGTWINHISISLFPPSLMYLVTVFTKLLLFKCYNLNFPLQRQKQTTLNRKEKGNFGKISSEMVLIKRQT